MPLDEIIRQRLEKIARLAELGIDAYAYRFDPDLAASELATRIDELAAAGTVHRIAGRVMLKRPHGKAGFAHLEDRTGRVQIYARLDRLGECGYEVYRASDVGDFLGVAGTAFRTRTGEPTLEAAELTLLSKSLRPLPEKWHGLQDVELRYRKRYLDLVMNPGVRRVFEARCRIVQAARAALDRRGFLEVETPALQPLYGGAAARPFVTHHNTLDMPLYLRVADELYLKRLLVGGLERVYEIAKDFRNEGMDRSHNPEFTMLECYQAYADYTDMMELFETLVASCAEAACGRLQVDWGEHVIDLTPPYPRRPMLELIEEHAHVDVSVMDDEALRRAYRDLAPADEAWAGKNRGQMIDEIFKAYVEPHLIQPVFVTDHPVEISPLARRHRTRPGLVERFEPFITGWELGNAFSELADPLEQRRRFEAQLELRRAGDEEAHQLDEDFLEALEHGMPPAGGLGVGIDRLVMLLTGSRSIQDVILFPQMRRRAD